MSTPLVPQSPAPAPPPSIKIPEHVLIGGAFWSREMVYWGSVGAGNKHAMLGRWSGTGKRGRPTKEAVVGRTVDVWDCDAVYVLFDGEAVEYVGEGKLGDRLYAHCDDPLKTWDRFSWFATSQYEIKNDAACLAARDKVALDMHSKAFIEFVELLLIYGGSPRANSQVPEKAGGILWLDQVLADGATGSLQDRLDRIERLLVDAVNKAKK